MERGNNNNKINNMKSFYVPLGEYAIGGIDINYIRQAAPVGGIKK